MDPNWRFFTERVVEHTDMFFHHRSLNSKIKLIPNYISTTIDLGKTTENNASISIGQWRRDLEQHHKNHFRVGMAHILLTNRSFQYDTVGISYVGSICNLKIHNG